MLVLHNGPTLVVCMYCLFTVLLLKGLMLLLTLYQLLIHNTLMYRALWQVKALLTHWRGAEKQGTSHLWNKCEMECGTSHSCLFQQFPPGSCRGRRMFLCFRPQWKQTRHSCQSANPDSWILSCCTDFSVKPLPTRSSEPDSPFQPTNIAAL